MEGRIKTLVTDRGFGFIKSQEGSEWFFHRSDMLPDKQEFDQLTMGESVDFVPTKTDKGPRATQVRRF